MAKNQIVNIVSSSEEIGENWKCLVEKKLGFKGRCYLSCNINTLSRDEILNTLLWIIEVWDNDNLKNPVGFRTAYQLAGSFRILLVFNRKPEIDFPDEGTFWITYSYFDSIIDKINTILDQKPVLKADFEILLSKYPELGYIPKDTHH
jgi:hypothetical protein